MIYPFENELKKKLKWKKLLANFHDKKDGIHTRNLKQALSHGLVFTKIFA